MRTAYFSCAMYFCKQIRYFHQGSSATESSESKKGPGAREVELMTSMFQVHILREEKAKCQGTSISVKKYNDNDIEIHPTISNTHLSIIIVMLVTSPMPV